MGRYQAKYTEVLINLLENEQTKNAIDQALSTYPMYEPTSENEFIPRIVPTREELNKKILDYYKYREIGFETVGRFIDELQIAMNEIMPYYNQLFFTQDLDFNVIYNVDYVRTIDRNKEEARQDNTTTSSQASDSTQTSATVNNYTKNVSSDTPQNSLGISNVDIDDVNYANNVTWNHSTTSDSGTSTGSSTTTGSGTTRGTLNDEENTVETTKGNFGVTSAQDLVKKYREIIINVEQQIINDPRITELFMLVF